MQAPARFGPMVTIGAAATLAGIVLLPAAALAVAPESALDVARKGDVVANGAAVKIPFTYSCPKGWQGSAGITIVEALDDSFASGYGGRNLKCTGEVKKVTFYVQANVYEGARPFLADRPASVVANLDAWDPAGTDCGEGMPCPMPPHDGHPGGRSSDRSEVKEPSAVHKDFTGTIQLKD